MRLREKKEGVSDCYEIGMVKKQEKGDKQKESKSEKVCVGHGEWGEIVK